MLDSIRISTYSVFIRTSKQPATLSWRPLVLCVSDVFLTT